MKQLVRFSVLGLLAFSATTFGGQPPLFQVTIEELHATPLVDGGAPAKKVEFTQRGVIGCAISPAPSTTRAYELWFEGSVSEVGKLNFDLPHAEGGAVKDITACARSVLLNNPIRVDAPERYRLVAKVTFKKVKP